MPIGEDDHTVVRGVRFDSTSPDMTAPGVRISSSCDSTGSVIGPRPQGGGDSTGSASALVEELAPGRYTVEVTGRAQRVL